MTNTPKGGTPPPPNKPKGTATPPHGQKQMTQRQLTRYERDRRRQRFLIFSALGTIALIFVIILIGLYQSVIGPNIKELANVSGQSITSGDYYKFRKLELFKTIAQYQQFINSIAGDQRNQILQQISQLQAEIDDVQKYPVNQETLTNLVSLRVAEKAAKDEFGIDPSDDDVKRYLDSQFGTELQLSTPTPSSFGAQVTPTLSAVETALVIQNTATANAITPLPTPTPSVSPTASPTPTTVAATPTAGTAATGTPGTTTPTVNASPTVTATNTPVPTKTPLPGEQAQQTLSASQNSFFDSLRKATGLTQDDYKKLELRPRLIKTLVSDRLLAKVQKIGDPVKQFRASAISVQEQVAAVELVRQLRAAPENERDALFVKLAREKSLDSVTASKNGDLGWFIQYQLSSTATEDAAWDALDKIQLKQFTEPLKVTEGWQILYLTGREEQRPLEERQFRSEFDTDQNGDYRVYVRWLKGKLDAAKPQYFTSPTPTVEPTQVPAAPFTPVIQPTATPNLTATAVVNATLTPQPTSTTVVVGPVPGALTPTPTGTVTATTTAATTTTATTGVVTTTAAGTVTPTPTR